MLHDQSKHRESPIHRPSGAQQRRIYHRKERPEARPRPYLATGGAAATTIGRWQAAARPPPPTSSSPPPASPSAPLQPGFILRQEEVELDGKVVDRKGRLTAVTMEVRKKESGELVAIVKAETRRGLEDGGNCPCNIREERVGSDRDIVEVRRGFAAS